MISSPSWTCVRIASLTCRVSCLTMSFAGKNIKWFYGYSLVFYAVTTFFSVLVCLYTLCFYHSFWSSSSNSKDLMPSAVKATLRLMVRFIVADVTCNFGCVYACVWCVCGACDMYFCAVSSHHGLPGEGLAPPTAATDHPLSLSLSLFLFLCCAGGRFFRCGQLRMESPTQYCFTLPFR